MSLQTKKSDNVLSSKLVADPDLHNQILLRHFTDSLNSIINDEYNNEPYRISCAAGLEPLKRG